MQSENVAIERDDDLIGEAEARTYGGGVSPSAWYRGWNEGRFPQPIRIGGLRLLRWRRGDLIEWRAAGCPDLRQSRHTTGRRGRKSTSTPTPAGAI